MWCGQLRKLARIIATFDGLILCFEGIRHMRLIRALIHGLVLRGNLTHVEMNLLCFC